MTSGISVYSDSISGNLPTEGGMFSWSSVSLRDTGLRPYFLNLSNVASCLISLGFQNISLSK